MLNFWLDKTWYWRVLYQQGYRFGTEKLETGRDGEEFTNCPKLSRRI